MLRVYFTKNTLPHPLPEAPRDLSQQSTVKTRWGSWRQYPWKCGVSRRLWSPGLSHSHAGPHSASTSSSKVFLPAMAEWLLLHVKQLSVVTLDSPLSPDFEATVCPANLVVWRIQEKSLFVFFCLVFNCCRTRVTTSKLFACLSGNQKSFLRYS